MKVFMACFIFLVAIVIVSVMGIITLQSANNEFASFYHNKFLLWWRS